MAAIGVVRALVGIGCVLSALWVIETKVGEIKLGALGSRLFSLVIIATVYYGIIKFDFAYDFFSRAASFGFGQLEPSLYMNIIVLCVPAAGLVYGVVLVRNNRSIIVPEIKSLIYNDIWLLFAAALALFASILL